MKKGLLVLALLASINALAFEVQLKGGYEPFRRFSLQKDQNKDTFLGSESGKLKKGFVVNAELLPVNTGRLEFGVGAEYSKLSFVKKQSTVSTPKSNQNITEDHPRSYYNIPVYGLVKANIIQLENGDSPLSVVGKLGYAFVGETVDKNQTKFNDSITAGGLYYGVGLNSEFGPLVVEALFSRTHLGNEVVTALGSDEPSNKKTDGLPGVINRFGITAGVRIGNGYKEEMIEEIEEPVVVEPVVVEPVVVEPVVVEPVKDVIVVKDTLPTSCSTDAKHCTIHGFAVDGRVPSKEEANALKEIAKIVNEYAVEGFVNIVGHTDSTGSLAYNQRLSEARAKSVARLLKENGLKEGIELKTSGKGETQPMSTNKTKAGRYENRRVELFFNDVDYK